MTRTLPLFMSEDSDALLKQGIQIRAMFFLLEAFSINITKLK